MENNIVEVKHVIRAVRTKAVVSRHIASVHTVKSKIIFSEGIDDALAFRTLTESGCVCVCGQITLCSVINCEYSEMRCLHATGRPIFAGCFIS
jgi:hypothetical protein